MLPYGTLWKLDQMLHPTGPPRRRTVAMRRRQALFLFLWGILLVTVFLLPYHYVSLRRVRIEVSRRLRGVSAPQVNAAELEQQQQRALYRLTKHLTARDDEAVAAKVANDVTARITTDFATVFRYHPHTEVRLHGMFDHPQLRTLAGVGSGKLWRRISQDLPAAALRGGQQPTLAEAAAASLASGSTGRATCLAALRRDYLISRLGSGTVNQYTELTESVRRELHRLGKLQPLTVSLSRAVDANVSSDLSPTENALARLLLWIAHDSDLPEEAVARTVAGCTASMSHSLSTSFDLRQVSNGEPPHIRLFATTKEVAESQLPYVCLCSGSRTARATALTAAANDGVTTVGLFLIDPRQSGSAVPTNCVEACRA